MKLGQSNFNLRSPDSDLVRSYLIAIVKTFNAWLKFRFSEKATNVYTIFLIWLWRLLSKCQNHKENRANFCGLLRKAELYQKQRYGYLMKIKVVQNCFNPLWNKLAHHSLQACQMRRFHFKLNGAIFWPLYSFWPEKISRSRKNATTVFWDLATPSFAKTSW